MGILTTSHYSCDNVWSSFGRLRPFFLHHSLPWWLTNRWWPSYWYRRRERWEIKAICNVKRWFATLNSHSKAASLLPVTFSFFSAVFRKTISFGTVFGRIMWVYDCCGHSTKWSFVGGIFDEYPLFMFYWLNLPYLIHLKLPFLS